MSDVKRYRFKGAAGEYVYSADYDAAQSELSALREELARKDVVIEDMLESNSDMTTCLAAAEQRNATITQLLRQAATYGGLTPLWHDKVQRFIKPTESGASE